MAKSQGTFTRRQLARLLRRVREERRLNIEEVARRMHWSPATLSRIERAENGVDVHAVKSLLDIYDIGGQEWASTIQLALKAREPGWWHAYGIDSRGYIALESEACLIRTFQLGYVPGLLQTASYAQVIYDRASLSLGKSNVEDQVAIRMKRQERLAAEEETLTLHAIIDGTVLTRPHGSTQVMRDQLRRIVELAARPNVTVQVIPQEVGPHIGLDGTFMVLSFPEPEDDDVGYIEHVAGSAHLEKNEDVRACTLAFDRLAKLALDPTESVAFTGRLATEL